VGCPYGSMTAQGREIVPALGSMGDVCRYVCVCVYMLSAKGVAVGAAVEREVWDGRS